MIDKVIQLKPNATIDDMIESLNEIKTEYGNLEVYLTGINDIFLNVYTENKTVCIDTEPFCENESNDKRCEKVSNDKETFYIVWWESSNPAASENCDACLGFNIYDENGVLCDGGELDYNSEEQTNYYLDAAGDIVNIALGWDVYGMEIIRGFCEENEKLIFCLNKN